MFSADVSGTYPSFPSGMNTIAVDLRLLDFLSQSHPDRSGVNDDQFIGMGMTVRRNLIAPLNV